MVGPSVLAWRYSSLPSPRHRSSLPSPARPPGAGLRRYRPAVADDEAQRSPRDPWEHGRRWAVLAGVLLVGLAQVATPFTGDQALFTVFGREANEGATYYVDLWDLKQPLLFLWYQGAGAVAGYTDVGVHLVEVLYLGAFAAVLPRLLRGHLSSARAAAIAPALSIGVYFVAAEAIDLTQAEVLAGPIVFVAVWAAALAEPSDRARLFFAGICIGLATVLKLTFLPVAVAGLLVAMLEPGSGTRWRRIGGVLVWSTLGAAVPVMAVVGWLAASGALEPALRAWFEVAPDGPANASPPTSRLLRTVGRYLLAFGPVVLLAAAALTRLRSTGLRARRPAGDSAERPRLLLGMTLWIALAIPAFLVQHWWPYLLQIVVIPVGVLAAEGVDVVGAWRRRSPGVGRAAVGVVTIATVVAVAVAFPKWADLTRHGFGVTASGRAALDEEAAAYARGQAFRSGVDVPGDAYVLGDPTLLLVADRGLGIPTNGWLPELLGEEEWQRVADELRAEQPPVVVIDEDVADAVADRAAPALDVIDEGWCEVGSSGPDTWYVRRDLTDC